MMKTTDDLLNPEPREDAAKRRAEVQQWLENWFRLGEELSAAAPPGPSARQIIEEDRSRVAE